MSKSEQKEVRLEIRLPKGGYPKTMFFNRFRVEREDGFCIVHFGLVASSGLLQDYYCCVLPHQTLQENEKSLVGYLGKIGEPKEKCPAGWQGVIAGQKAEVADIISMSLRSDMAETSFCVFSMTAASRFKPGGSTEALEAQPLVLLRSAVEMQKQLLVALYEE